MIPSVVAHYEVLERIGHGGMGVVHRARDQHLGRFVAIKFLPPEAMADPDRKRRFVREARAASSLNHPNIVTVHDISCFEGLDFMVMELVAGRTLDQLIRRDGLTLAEALRYGAQIAGALAQAHAAGIVHRDLKPGNVMVTERGLVKVLDFGLAKLSEPLAVGAVSSMAPTDLAAATLTTEGAVVGTVAYMSPEQAEGKKVDARTDVFSFGAVLYEMVCGQPAFPGNSAVAILSAILQKEPAPLRGLVREAPPELEKVLSRCLRKDPERRVQHLGDVKLALEELLEDLASGAAPEVAPRRPRFSRWAAAAGLVLLLTAVAGTTWRLARPPSGPPAPILTRLTSDPGLASDPALSPDGRLLAYASDRSGEDNLDIYVQQVGGGAPLRLTREAADESEPTFSPDGTTIAFRSEKDGGGVYTVPALGGPARLAASGGKRPRFSPDGSQLAYWVGVLGGASLSRRDSASVFVVPVAGGPPRQVQSGFVAAAYPVWSPDSRHLLFLGNRDNDDPPEVSVDWWVSPLDAGPAVKTGALEATREARLSGDLEVYSWALLEPAWEPAGVSLVFSARHGDSTNLWRIGISPETFRAEGSPQRVTSGPTLEKSPSIASGPDGGSRAAFASLTESRSFWSLPVEANQGKVVGERTRIAEVPADGSHVDLSGDGKRMVFLSKRSGYQEVWVRDLRSGDESALTTTRSMKHLPSFSPDGSRVGFAEPGTWDTYVMPAAGGTPEMVCKGCGQLTSWSSDGKRILCNALDGRVTLYNLDSRQRTSLVAVAGHWLCCGLFSPDDRWISFFDATAGQAAVVPFTDEAPIPEASASKLIDGWLGIWSPDGRLVYTISQRDGHRCIWAQRLDPATRRPVDAPFAVFHHHSARLSLWYFNIRRDQIELTFGERTGTIWMVEWKDR